MQESSSSRKWSPSNDSLSVIGSLVYCNIPVKQSPSTPQPSSPFFLPTSCLILRHVLRALSFLRHLPLLFSISVCLLCCVLLRGFPADVIYVISFASMRRERPEANTRHIECSRHRLWASTDWATAAPVATTLHTMQQPNLWKDAQPAWWHRWLGLPHTDCHVRKLAGVPLQMVGLTNQFLSSVEFVDWFDFKQLFTSNFGNVDRMFVWFQDCNPSPWQQRGLWLWPGKWRQRWRVTPVGQVRWENVQTHSSCGFFY